MSAHRILTALLPLFLWSAPVRAQESQSRRKVTAQRTQAAPRIDGVLDEASWEAATPSQSFVERDPIPGGRPPVEHTIKVLYDRDAIYVGVRIGLAPDERPRALELSRDSFAVFDDDAISLKFDVRLDERTTVGFAINAAGAQLDYLALENGREFRREYDAVWTAEATVEQDAWTAEFRIPVVALGLPSTDGEVEVGFNITHDHNSKVSTYDWSPIPAEFGAVSAQHYGRISGLDGIAGGVPLVLIPYVLAGWEEDASESGPDFGIGGDLQLRAGPDLWLEGTVLPDFAQVDLDDPVVNVDRFPLFLPERRPFFLNGLQVFDFGISGVSQLFFSRRIGLSADADSVPVWGGVKSYGRGGPLQVGVFQVLTAETQEEPSASWSIARTRINFNRNAHLGLLGTMQVDLQGDASPRIGVGADGSLSMLEQRLQLRGFGAFTSDDEGEGWSGAVETRYRGTLVNPSHTILVVTEGFDPAIGFVRRQNIIQNDFNLEHVWRTTEFGLSRITTQVTGQTVQDLVTGEPLGQTIYLQSTVRTRGGLEAAVSLRVEEDVVREPFELLRRAEIAAGRYRGPDLFFAIATPGRRNPAVHANYNYDGAFFGGVRHEFHLGGIARIGPHFSTALEATARFIRLPQVDEFWTGNGTFNIRVTPTRNVVADVGGQLNTVEERVTTFVRLRWRFLPGSDLFAVYRERFSYANEPAERMVTAKGQLRFDFLL